MLKECPHHIGKVPQHFGTQFERPNPGRQVAHVYNAWLPYVFFGCDPSHIFFDLWKRYQVCREVDSPGQSGSGNQDLGPRQVSSTTIPSAFQKNIESAYDNLYSCIRSRSVNSQILVIFQWQWHYMTWKKSTCTMPKDSNLIKMRVNLHQFYSQTLHLLDLFSSCFVTFHRR